MLFSNLIEDKERPFNKSALIDRTLKTSSLLYYYNIRITVFSKNQMKVCINKKHKLYSLILNFLNIEKNFNTNKIVRWIVILCEKMMTDDYDLIIYN